MEIRQHNNFKIHNNLWAMRTTQMFQDMHEILFKGMIKGSVTVASDCNTCAILKLKQANDTKNFPSNSQATRIGGSLV